ncbi:hypothetical protein GN958_ATG20638 [Phytophthora infestans]|uniref:Uncharacterized protein n=1 Tax=Phytophthora infestans TaxID=4787 RepID=A0A8S9TQG4_PHYIN|nr:hypothetical protein GN958_ATG20638 [Phytophthora infestans]
MAWQGNEDGRYEWRSTPTAPTEVRWLWRERASKDEGGSTTQHQRYLEKKTLRQPARTSTAKRDDMCFYVMSTVTGLHASGYM